MRSWCALLLTLAISGAAAQSPSAEAVALLERSARAYAAVTTYRDQGVVRGRLLACWIFCKDDVEWHLPAASDCLAGDAGMAHRAGEAVCPQAASTGVHLIVRHATKRAGRSVR